MRRAYQRNRYVLLLDVVAWCAIPLLLLTLRLEGLRPLGPYVPALASFVVLAVPIKFVFLWRAGLYQRVWRYASVDELIDVVSAVGLAGIAVAIVYFFVVVPLSGQHPRLPRSTPIIDVFMTVLQVGGVRFFSRAMERLRHRRTDQPERAAVLVFGAGDAGAMTVRELRQNPQLKLEPVAFLDDDRAKHGTYIHGLRVEGGRERLPEIAKAYNAGQVIIAMPRATGAVVREIRDRCEEGGLEVKTVPGMYDIISGKVTVGALRNVQIEDLLRREPVVTDHSAVAGVVRGATVLVSGAGGSIGSELCRQTAQLGAGRLVLLGHGENSIFDIHNELRSRYPAVDCQPVIADIRDERRIQWVFDHYRPRAVFHAAAHKHVPLMELNPDEAVTNNVGGTLALLRHAERTVVSHFVFISTDKAVNPTNVMGAAKLLGERLVHEFGRRTGRVYVSVRFGNVLGSRGSVVPFFQQQIARGGPVTVTHEDIRRYFMTIPEAVQLVLQAAALGKGGETFVLDMGEPVKIVDLATDLIRLSGLEPGKDVEIVFTGLRPGEKMFEEMFLDGEDYARTAHEKIFVARNGDAPPLLADVERLLAAAHGRRADDVRVVFEELMAQAGRTAEPTPGPQTPPAPAPILSGPALQQKYLRRAR